MSARGANQVEEITDYLKSIVQNGLHASRSPRLDAPDREWLTHRTIEKSVETEDDDRQRAALEILFALGGYRAVPAAERRKRFAGLFGKTNWTDVSRSLYPSVVGSFATRLSEISQPVNIEGLRTRERWDDLEVSYKVISVNLESDTYCLRSDYRMNVSVSTMVFAQCDDEVLAESICSVMPEVLEVMTPVDDGRCEFRAYVRSMGSTSTWQELRFYRDRALRDVFESKRPGSASPGLVFWRSEEISGLDSPRLRLVCDWELKFSWNYFQWSVPHHAWLHRFTADLAKFVPVLDGHPIAALPALAQSVSVSADQDTGVFEIDVDGLVAPGQTIKLDWGPI